MSHNMLVAHLLFRHNRHRASCFVFNKKIYLIVKKIIQCHKNEKFITSREMSMLCEANLLKNKALRCNFMGKYIHTDDKRYCGRHLPRPDCVICLEKCDLNTYTKLGCTHSFHTLCIQKWVKSGHFTCPLCRQELPTEFDIPWFRMTGSFRHEEFVVLPKYHPKLMSEQVLDFLFLSGMSFDNILQLQFEEPDVYWEYANLVRYLSKFGNYEAEVIINVVGRKFKPFAVKYSLQNVLLNNFNMRV